MSHDKVIDGHGSVQSSCLDIIIPARGKKKKSDFSSLPLIAWEQVVLNCNARRQLK